MSWDIFVLFISGWYTRACARIQPKSDATTLTSISPFPLQLICCYTLSSQEVMLTVSLTSVTEVSLLLSVSCSRNFSVLNERFSIWWPKDNIHPILHIRPQGAVQPPLVCFFVLSYASCCCKASYTVHRTWRDFFCSHNSQLVVFYCCFYFILFFVSPLIYNRKYCKNITW